VSSSTSFFNQPYCRIENLVDAGIAKRQTVSRYLATLADIGVLSIAGRRGAAAEPQRLETL
jgi:Fic family protein